MKKIKITKCKYKLKYDYYITDDGRIYSDKTKKFLSTHLDKNGYVKVRLVSIDGRHTYSVHRLIMENFKPIKNMENLQVNHIDGNKENNNLDNLEWTTYQENINHAINNNLRANQKGSHNPGSKLTEEQVLKIVERLQNHDYIKYSDIGDECGVSAETIGAIKRRNNWAWLTKNFNF